jgi:hypothetical protein
MEGWSDDLVRAGIVPLVAESQLHDEEGWCRSRGLAKIGLAGHHKPEIEPHLPRQPIQRDPSTVSSDHRTSSRYSSTRFNIFSDVNRDISWFFSYIEKVYDQLKDKFGHEPTQYLPIKYTIKQGKPGGIGGWTSAGEMGVEAGDFEKNRWCLVISAQELVNLFTGSISSGWPTDWWANHKSPFPIMAAVDVVRDLGYTQEAKEYDREFEKDSLYVWHRNMKRTHGWSLYRNMFSAVKADGIQWDRIGANPSKLRTNYVLAYMGIGAGRLDLPSVAEMIQDADLKMVEEIMRVRERAKALPHIDQRWTQFVTGNYARSA